MDIVEELRRDRESGAKRLEAEYKAGLMTLARRFCVDEGDAEELVNRTFAAVVEGIDDYLEQSAFFAWMCQILTNIHKRDSKRKSNQRVVYPGVVPEMVDEDAQEAIYRNLDYSLLRDAIEGMPTEMRELLLLHYFMDIPIPKLAKILAVPAGTVKSRLHYARSVLAARFGAKAKEAVKKPGVKATLLALALCALTAAGAAVTAAVRGGERAAAILGSGGVVPRAAAFGETGGTGGTSGVSPAAPVPMPVPLDSPVPPVITSPATSLSHSPTLSLSHSTQGEQNMNKTTLLAASAALALFATADAGATTLTWTGAANNNLWCDANNWDSGGETISFTAANDYVFNDLPDGTTLTVSSSMYFKTIVMNVDTVANATWTITGSGMAKCLGTGRGITVPPGCTLNLDIAADNYWDDSNNYTLSGGGTVRHSKTWSTWDKIYYVMGDSTLVLAAGGFECSRFAMYDTATLKLEKDTEIVCAYTASGTPSIDLNGFILKFNQFNATGNWTGGLAGAGTETFTLMGERTWTLNSTPTFSGTYDLANGWLEMGAAASMPSNATVNVRGSGQLLLKTDQTLSAISGTAATGGIDIPANATLTVAGKDGEASASEFGGRLTGDGALVKDGADYTLTLTGENFYTGQTRVVAGILELKRDTAPDSDIAYHFTFDGDDFLKDSIHGVSLTVANSPIHSTGDGVAGDCMALDGTHSQRLELSGGNTIALSSGIYTLSLWIRPTATGNGTLFRWGDGWYGDDYRLAHVHVASATQLDGYGGVSATAPAGVSLTDGQWHHVVYTQEPWLKSLWIDGELCGTNVPAHECETYRNNIQFGAVDSWGCYSGSLDEIILANGTWPEERIRRETARCRAANDLRNAAERLPRPVAKWTFDDGYADSINGIELVSCGTGAPSLIQGGGAYGKFVRLASDAALGQAAGAPFPECMPTGRSPFAVSIRYRHNSAEWRHAFGWGDTSSESRFFAIGIGGSIRYNTLNWSHAGDWASWVLSDVPANGWLTDTAWEHIVATYDGSTVSAYRDGVLQGSWTGQIIDIKPQDLFLGYRPNRNTYCTCDIDDVRVWNSALSAAQVRVLAQSLGTDEVGSAVPAASPVTVDAGATLKVAGTGHEAGSLAGGGTVRIDSYSALTVNGGGAFAGTLSGCGSLVLKSGADLSTASADGFTGEIRAEGGTVLLNGSFSGGIASVASGGRVVGGAQRTLVDDGCVIATDRAGTGLPIVSGTGTAVIPATGSVAFSTNPGPGNYVLVDAGACEAPEDLSGWTVSGTSHRANFLVGGGQFILRLNGGTTIMLR